ncbi:MAG: hypothetical protein MJH10_14640 [Epibacterium sp.]|nr:hypothetical protein [Epibacterium sp.]NQX74765.1 hypothetical protein [Epibacterium sp.]
MSFGNAFLAGLNSGRREQSRRMAENRLEEEAARTAQNFARRQRGLDALEQRFGQEANAPTELGQLEGIDQRRTMFPVQLEQAQENLAAFQDERSRNSAVIGFDLLDKRVQQAVAANEDPVSAVLDFAGSMTPQARQLLGIEGDDLGGALEVLNADPAAFGQMRDALRPPPVRTSTGKAVQRKGFNPETQQWEWTNFDPVTGQPEFTGIPSGPPNAPTRLGTDIIDTARPEGAERINNRSEGAGALQAAAQATEMGQEQGEFLGRRWAADQTLSTTESNEALQLLEGEIGRAENTLTVIDEAIDQVDWTSAGTLQGLRLIDGSTPANVAATLQTVQANAIIDQLVAIKRTGATLGQITERELEVLQNSVAALGQSQTPQQLRRNLERYRSQLSRTLGRARSNIERDIKRGRLNPSDDLVAGLFPEVAQTQSTGDTDALDAWLNQ